ncbi:hypothetical protein K0M31_016856 [Melipona bicolor]|uniref:Uncharacterized protein n=1 Tax=Melipona bicolor TaxID=60889 RepID=A0AA40FE22_9HYME|nr:hypothetical protein K0M31_016856 [Melipona bicolor]
MVWLVGRRGGTKGKDAEGGNEISSRGGRALKDYAELGQRASYVVKQEAKERSSRNRADIPHGRSWFDVHVRVSRSTVLGAETIARQIHAGDSESLDSETSVN